MKPYYNPSTKETYNKYVLDNGTTIKFITGSVSLDKHPTDKTKGIKTNRNQFGEIVSKEEFNSHYVCIGYDYCQICGRKMSNGIETKQKKWWKFWE